MSRRFSFNWRVSTFAAVCLVSFVNLGFWQLARESEKRELIAVRESRQSKEPVSAIDLPDHLNLAGVLVQLTGQYGDVVALLDNRVLEGRVGFEVHQAFFDESDRVFLVNRGFVVMARTRQDPPAIPEIRSGRVSIRGSVYQRRGVPLQLKREQGPIVKFPAIVQQVDMSRLSESLGTEIYPYVIRLAPDQFGALPRHWPETVMQPEQHRGYAIQWFVMAIAVLIAWLFFSFREEEEQK